MVIASSSTAMPVAAMAIRSPMTPGLTPTPNSVLPPSRQADVKAASRSCPCARG